MAHCYISMYYLHLKNSLMTWNYCSADCLWIIIFFLPSHQVSNPWSAISFVGSWQQSWIIPIISIYFVLSFPFHAQQKFKVLSKNMYISLFFKFSEWNESSIEAEHIFYCGKPGFNPKHQENNPWDEN